MNAANEVEQRHVEFGISVGNMRVVKTGLKPDEKVVINGLQRARPKSTVTTKLYNMDGTPIPDKESDVAVETAAVSAAADGGQ